MLLLLIQGKDCHENYAWLHLLLENGDRSQNCLLNHNFSPLGYHVNLLAMVEYAKTNSFEVNHNQFLE
jgi:hypothetical protein